MFLKEIMTTFLFRVLWLRVAVTNNNPKVIAHYYLNCVTRLEGIIQLYIALPALIVTVVLLYNNIQL